MKRQVHSVVIVFFVWVSVPELLGGLTNCGGIDFAPCECSCTDGGVSTVECDNVTIEDIKESFKQANDLNLFQIGINHLTTSTDQIIPHDLVQNAIAGIILIGCENVIDGILRIDPDAFRSCRESTSTLMISSCILSLIDYSFLNGFSFLSSLTFEFCHNPFLNFGHLPPLPLLLSLTLRECSGLHDPPELPVLMTGLKSVAITYSDLSDESISAITEWLSLTSVDSLRTLSLSYNQLTIVPSQMTKFKQLNQVDLANNRINLISAGLFNFQKPVSKLSLSGCGIDVIDPDSFQGDYSIANVKLDGNNLTQFPASVFESVLSQMASSGSESSVIDVKDNPFDCHEHLCGLSWLVVENPHLMKALENARCSNGTNFANLTAEGILETCFKETTARTSTYVDGVTNGEGSMTLSNFFNYSTASETTTAAFSNSSITTDESISTSCWSLQTVGEAPKPCENDSASTHPSTDQVGLSTAANPTASSSAGGFIVAYRPIYGFVFWFATVTKLDAVSFYV